MQVPVVRTVCSPKQYAHAFIKAWRGLGYDSYPTQAQCGVLYAQWMVETSGRACWNWNIGNVKVSQSQVDAGVPWLDLPGTWEIIAGKRVVLPEGHPGRRFRAFDSLDDAMREHLAFLRNKRYAPSWPFVEAGDPDGFARAIKTQGYYTASADDYARIMVAAFRQWMQSTAYPDALAEVLDTSDAPTLPELPVADDDSEATVIVHPWHFRDDDEPPPAAA